MAGGVLASASAPVEAKAADPITISTAEEFKTFFNGIGTGNATYTGADVTLAADIDLTGVVVTNAHGGGNAYTGTFDGQDHTVTNLVLDGTKCLFQGLSGTVKNLNLEIVSTGNASTGLAYQNNGTITDCDIVISSTSAVNSIGFYSYLEGSGSYTNLGSHMLFATSSNTIGAVYFEEQEAVATVTNCLYTNNTGATAIRECGATSSTEVSYIVSDTYSVSIASGTTQQLNITTCGNASAAVSYSSADGNVATVSDSGLITGVAAGNTTITVSSGSLSRSIAVEIISASPVTAVSISPETLSIEEGATGELSAVLAGTNYDSIEWTSANSELVSVAGDGLTATVTGVAVTEGTYVIVTVTVGETSVTDTISVVVTEPAGFYVTFLVPYGSGAGDVGTLPWGDTAYGYIYNGGTNTAEPWERVKVNGNIVSVNYNGDPCYVYSRFVTASVFKVDAGSHIQIYYDATGGRWGGGIHLAQTVDQWSDVTFIAPEEGKYNPTRINWTHAQIESALAYAGDTVYSTSWRDSNSSICYLLEETHATELNNVLSGYDAITDTVVKGIVDSIVDGSCSLGDTIAMLKAESTYNAETQTYVANAALAREARADMQEGTVIAIILGVIAAVGVGGGFLVVRRRRNRA